MSAVVLLAHGSPDPRSGDAVRAAAARLAERSGRTVRAAFLDHDEPRLDRAVLELADGHVTVLPLLLSRAFHARVDVPAAVSALPHEVDLLDPLGHPAAVLDGELRRAPGPVVVVAAGTGVAQERDAFADAVAAASARTGVAAGPAFLTGPGPSVTETLEHRPGAALLAWLLAPGRLLDALHVLASAAGSDVLAPDGLLAAGVLDDLLLTRVGPRPALT